MSDNTTAYTGSGLPDLGRRPERAGQKVEEKGFLLEYDERGYCVSAQNVNWVPPEDPEHGGGHWKE